jgi:hypothetical protein
VRGAVRSWLLSEEMGVLILNMRDNRYCGNVGRQHKSNGIFYVVDMQVYILPLLLPYHEANGHCVTFSQSKYLAEMLNLLLRKNFVLV